MKMQADALLMSLVIIAWMTVARLSSISAHQCVEGQKSYMGLVRKSYLESHQVYSHTEACWTFPFWCYIYKTEYRTAYRNEMEGKCCKEYYAQSVGYDESLLCLPKCNDRSCLNGGKCTGPDTCDCANGTTNGAGYSYEAGSSEDKGLKCDAVCRVAQPGWNVNDEGHWGKNCKNTCNHCRNIIAASPRCDVINGSCDCRDQWEGHLCNKRSEPCPPGTHGQRGKKGICRICTKCSAINANCLSSPWYGECECNIPASLSSDCTVCLDGYWGDECQHNCSSTCGRNNEGQIQCDKISSECSSCVDGYWGATCQNRCSNNCLLNSYDKRQCDKISSKCRYCEWGYWGDLCQNNCTCGISHSQARGKIYCDRISSKCPYCEHGYWGDTCQNCCTCAINATLGIRTSECDQSNGNCHCSYPKYKGPNCDEEVEPCPRGTFNIHGRKEGKCSMCPCYWSFSTTRHLNCNQDPWYGECSCDPGKVEIFKRDREGRLQSDSCSDICPCQNGGRCKSETFPDGTTKTIGKCDCSSTGHGGDLCEITCPGGKYGNKLGHECKEDCRCKKVSSFNKTCNIFDGQCNCLPAYCGKHCQNYQHGDSCNGYET